MPTTAKIHTKRDDQPHDFHAPQSAVDLFQTMVGLYDVLTSLLDFCWCCTLAPYDIFEQDDNRARNTTCTGRAFMDHCIQVEISMV